MASDKHQVEAATGQQQALQSRDNVERHKQRTSTVGAHTMTQLRSKNRLTYSLIRPACHVGPESVAAMARSQHAGIAYLDIRLASILTSRSGGGQVRGRFPIIRHKNTYPTSSC